MEQSLSAVDKQSEHDSDKYPERSQSPTREQGPSPQTMGGVSWGWEENRNEEGAGDWFLKCLGDVMLLWWSVML